MLTTFLYLFTFSSWGLGLLAALTALSIKLQEHGVRMKAAMLEVESDRVDLEGKNLFIGRMSGNKPFRGVAPIPEELKDLMSRSPDHPEVSEIEEGDQVYGVVFKAHTYPPTMDEDDDNDNE